MREKRGHWYLLTGLIIGAAIGLAYAWIVQPVQYTNTAPESLRKEFKDQYRALIAAAYQANGDLVRAKARLELLMDEDSYRTLAEQAQRSLAEGKSFAEAQSLGLLAMALKNPPGQSTSGSPASPFQETTRTTETSQVDISTPLSTTPTNEQNEIPAIATPTSSLATTPSSSSILSTPLPAVPTATRNAPFVLVNKEQSCEVSFGQNLIQVFTLDGTGQPVPGIEIITTWEGGENHFFTGLKPDISIGYADFTMAPGITYTIRLAEGGQPVAGLAASKCTNEAGETYWGNWVLEFSLP